MVRKSSQEAAEWRIGLEIETGLGVGIIDEPP
jgi:hypothetical protein